MRRTLIEIKDGEIVWKSDIHKAQFFQSLRGLKDGKYYITVGEEKRTRNLGQNGLMHVLIGYIADFTGHSMGEMKTILKRKLLKPITIEYRGKRELVLPSTASLSVTDASEFIERLYAECAELEIVVPTPAELGYFVQ